MTKFVKDCINAKEYCEINIIPKLKNEKWIKLNTSVYTNIKDYYYISSIGRIFNINSKKFIKTRCLSKGTSIYYKVNLQVSIGNKSFSDVFLVHRLMMMSFNPKPGMEKLFVNHKDGNKLNDNLNNLEWVTCSENIIHAYNIGLFKPVKGEQHVCATITNKDVEKIAELLISRKYTQKEIAKIMNTTESIVNSIAQKKAWKDVTEKYDFSVLKQRIPKLLSFDDIRNCCRYFESHPKPENISVRRYCMIALHNINYSKPITEGCLNSIRYLYNKKRYVNISKEYNF